MSERNKTNTDQISFSSWWDDLKFHYWRGKGHILRYIIDRIRWHYYPGLHLVTDYPEHVDMELSSACNMQCPMCYTLTDEFKGRVKRQFMDEVIWRKVIDECAAGGVFSLRLSWRGEPTIHKQFIEAARYAKEKGINEVSSLTNCFALTPEMFEEMVKIGFDWLTISADGVGETYESIRKPAEFSEFIEKLKAFKEIKKKCNSVKPVVKVQTIWPAIENNQDEYYQTFKPLVDQISCNQLVDYLFQDIEKGTITYKEKFDCHVPYQRLTIGSDGKVQLCYNDENNHHVLGDINEQTIHEIWHGENMQKLRNMHRGHQALKEYKACQLCFLPRTKSKLTRVEIDGREVEINKLDGREQSVGQ
jgi:radical SAM protein with 4Fe4S-binding SPASM domain